VNRLAKRWTEKEVELLKELVEKGYSVQQILETGKFPGRSYEALDIKIRRCGFCVVCGTNNVEAIYSPPLPTSETKGLKQLIALEWAVIDRLWNLEQGSNLWNKHRVQCFNALASHARTLSKLLKLAGVTTEEKEDLAKLLAKIAKKVRRVARQMRTEKWREFSNY